MSSRYGDLATGILDTALATITPAHTMKEARTILRAARPEFDFTSPECRIYMKLEKKAVEGLIKSRGRGDAGASPLLIP